MTRRLLLATSLLATSLLPWGAGWAQQDGTDARATDAPATAAQRRRDWSIPKRRLDFYAGARSNGGDTDFMLGAKYSRRLPFADNFAAAGFVEVAFADETQYLVGALLQYMPVNRLLVETGPGGAFDGGSEFFWRVSAEYEMNIRKLFVIPKAYLDFVNGDTVFGYGLAIGRH